MAAYEALTKRLFFVNNNVKRFRSFVAMDRTKAGLEVPSRCRLLRSRPPARIKVGLPGVRLETIHPFLDGKGTTSLLKGVPQSVTSSGSAES